MRENLTRTIVTGTGAIAIVGVRGTGNEAELAAIDATSKEKIHALKMTSEMRLFPASLDPKRPTIVPRRSRDVHVTRNVRKGAPSEAS